LDSSNRSAEQLADQAGRDVIALPGITPSRALSTQKQSPGLSHITLTTIYLMLQAPRRSCRPTLPTKRTLFRPPSFSLTRTSVHIKYRLQWTAQAKLWLTRWAGGHGAPHARRLVPGGWCPEKWWALGAKPRGEYARVSTRGNALLVYKITKMPLRKLKAAVGDFPIFASKSVGYRQQRCVMKS